MALMVWIDLQVKEGNFSAVVEMMKSPQGMAFTKSQKGCERLERSILSEDSNHIMLTERWTSKEDWDTYFEIRQKEIEEGGFFSKLPPLLDGEDALKITFSAIDHTAG